MKGFTLVELLVVVAIIGLLSTIAAASIASARPKARDAKRLADMRQFASALEHYYLLNFGYPPSSSASGMALGVPGTSNTLSSGSGISGACSGTCYSSIPAYPAPPVAAACAGTFGSPTLTTPNYCYFTASTTGNQLDFKLQFHLESTNNSYGNDDCLVTSTGIKCT